jgi:hypothetical protein
MSHNNEILFRVEILDLIKQVKLPKWHYSISFSNSKLRT